MPERPPPTPEAYDRKRSCALPRLVLMDGDEARHAAALLVFAAHGVARAFRRDHADVEIGARLDQVEVDVEAVREHQRRALLHVGLKVVLVDVALQLVGRQHHDDVGPLGRLGDFHHLEAGALGLLGRGRALAQRDGHVLDAAILEVQRVRVTLAAVADDRDLLALDEIDVGITIVINAHGFLCSSRSVLCGCGGAAGAAAAGGTGHGRGR